MIKALSLINSKLRQEGLMFSVQPLKAGSILFLAATGQEEDVDQVFIEKSVLSAVCCL